MSLELAFNILLSLFGGVMGFVVRRILNELDEVKKRVASDDIIMREKIEYIRVNYVTNHDARFDHTAIMEALKGIKAKIDRLDDKLDKKADK